MFITLTILYFSRFYFSKPIESSNPKALVIHFGSVWVSFGTVEMLISANNLIKIIFSQDVATY